MLDRVDRRNKLAPRREPYWERLSHGRSIGFRRLTAQSPGSWIARAYDGAKYQQKPLGDFALLTESRRYDAAKKAAEEWFRHLDGGGSNEAATVRQACEAYVTELRTDKGDHAAKDAAGRFQRLVYDDPIARVELTKLAPRHVAEWKKRALAKGGTKGSYNRNATSLRAALNLAQKRRLVATNHAWADELKPFEDADGRRDLYLKRPARLKLYEKASPAGQRFIKTLLLLPLRPGDVAKLNVEHFNAHQKTLAIPTGKTKKRIVPLTNEAVAHFRECAKNKLPGAWLVSRDNGDQWKKEAWRDEIKAAAKTAKQPSATCAYTLRHCAITDLVMGGLDLFTVAKISGTSIAMIEKNYGHLQREHAREALQGLSLK